MRSIVSFLCLLVLAFAGIANAQSPKGKIYPVPDVVYTADVGDSSGGVWTITLGAENSPNPVKIAQLDGVARAMFSFGGNLYVSTDEAIVFIDAQGAVTTIGAAPPNPVGLYVNGHGLIAAGQTAVQYFKFRRNGKLKLISGVAAASKAMTHDPSGNLFLLSDNGHVNFIAQLASGKYDLSNMQPWPGFGLSESEAARMNGLAIGQAGDAWIAMANPNEFGFWQNGRVTQMLPTDFGEFTNYVVRDAIVWGISGSNVMLLEPSEDGTSLVGGVYYTHPAGVTAIAFAK